MYFVLEKSDDGFYAADWGFLKEMVCVDASVSEKLRSRRPNGEDVAILPSGTACFDIYPPGEDSR